MVHRVFADRKPFKGKEVHFADSQMYEGEKEEEEIAPLAENLQKDKGKAPQKSPEENKPSGKSEESSQPPFVISLKNPKPLVITTKVKKAKQKSGGKFVVSLVSIMQDTDSDSEPEDDASSSQADTQQVQPALTPMETPADVEDPTSATFVVPATSPKEKPIFFHRSDASSPNSLLEPFQNEGMPQLALYSPVAQAIMKKMGFDAQNPVGLGGGRGILTPLEPALTKSQLEDWRLYGSVEKSSYGLGYDPDSPLKQLTQRLKSQFVDQASTSRAQEDIDLPGYFFEESPDKDPGSSSKWYNFSDDEEESSGDTGGQCSDPEEPSSPKEIPDSTGDWDYLIASLEKITNQEDPWKGTKPWSGNTAETPEGFVELEASENIVEEPPSNLPTEDSVVSAVFPDQGFVHFHRSS